MTWRILLFGGRRQMLSRRFTSLEEQYKRGLTRLPGRLLRVCSHPSLGAPLHRSIESPPTEESPRMEFGLGTLSSLVTAGFDVTEPELTSIDLSLCSFEHTYVHTYIGGVQNPSYGIHTRVCNVVNSESSTQRTAVTAEATLFRNLVVHGGGCSALKRKTKLTWMKAKPGKEDGTAKGESLPASSYLINYFSC